VAAKPPSPWDDVVSVSVRAWRFARTHLLTIVLVAFVLSAGWTVWRVASAHRNRTVVLYTGSSTADANRLGDEIKKHFATNPPTWWVNYKVELRPSEGLKDNRRLVAESSPNELVLGVDQDGFNPPNSVRTLIPLTELYLHVVTLRSHVQATRVEDNPPPPEAKMGVVGGGAAAQAAAKPASATLTRMMRYFGERRGETKTPLAFLGPKGSGSRQLGEQVLARYGVDLRYADYGDHIGWDTAYRLLASGEIDVVFDASDMGSPYITKLAAEGRYQLLDLDKVEAMTAGENRFMRARKFPVGSYSSSQPFCPGDIATVSTQRTIVCHRDLSTFDAFHLTAGIREAVRGAVPTIPWDRPEPPQQTELISPLHQGARDYRHERQPLVWVNTILEKHWLTALSAVVTLALSLYHWRRSRRGETPPTQEGDPADRAPTTPSPPVKTTAAPLTAHHPTPGEGDSERAARSEQDFRNECVAVYKRIEGLKAERRLNPTTLHEVGAAVSRLRGTHAELLAHLGPTAESRLELQRLLLGQMNDDLTRLLSQSNGRGTTNGRKNGSGHRTRN
jgi:TRAP-type uncharacterized transport system substrate-binding protein